MKAPRRPVLAFVNPRPVPCANPDTLPPGFLESLRELADVRPAAITAIGLFVAEALRGREGA